MTQYRIYALGKGGQVIRGFDAECPDDAAAKAFALAGLGKGESREVWKGRQCIGFYIGPRGGGTTASRVMPTPHHGTGRVSDGLTHPESSPPPSNPVSGDFTTVILEHGSDGRQCGR